VGAPRNLKLVSVPPAARWLWLSAICWSKEQCTEGRVPEGALTIIGNDLHQPRRLAASLVRAGLWERAGDGDGWLVHDFLDWQESMDEIDERRARNAERMRRVRAAKRNGEDEPW
jgi:hypothetical protein